MTGAAQQAAEAPQTPQQAAPQAQVLRFGNFKQPDTAGGLASPARAAPLVRGSALPIRLLLPALSAGLTRKCTGLVCAPAA